MKKVGFAQFQQLDLNVIRKSIVKIKGSFGGIEIFFNLLPEYIEWSNSGANWKYPNPETNYIKWSGRLLISLVFTLCFFL